MDRSPFREMLQSLGHLPDEKEASFPMKEAQADVLRQVVELSTRERKPFSRGDAVHYMAGVGPLTRAANQGMVFIFWRMLEAENESDQNRLDNMNHSERTTLPDVDCMIAYFTGAAIQFDLACSSLLLPGDA